MPDHQTNPVELTHDGQRRRDAILRAAIAAGTHRRRKRLVIRAGALSVIGVALVGGLLLAYVSPRPAGDQTAKVANPAPITRPATMAATPPTPAGSIVVRRSPQVISISRIVTDPTLVDRLAIPRHLPPVERLDDEALVRELEKIGMPGGLVVRHGRTELVLLHR